MFEKILLAVDGSENSRRAIPAAREMAEKTHGSVLVFHALELQRARDPIVEPETPSDAEKLVQDVVDELKKDGVEARGEVVATHFGHAADRIVEEAQHEGAGVIVMGSRGLSALGELLMGSVAHRVIQHAPSPVLVVR